MRTVMITYKTDPNTGLAFRPPFETTEANLEDQERLFGDKIKDIKFVGGARVPASTIEKKPNKNISEEGSTEANIYEAKIKEQNSIIARQADAIISLEKEIEELKNKKSVGRPKKEMA